MCFAHFECFMSVFSKIFVILDIGSSKIDCAVVKIAADFFDILWQYQYKTNGFSNGYVTDMRQFSDCVANIISKTSQESNIIIDNVILILSGPYFSSEYFNGKLLMKNSPVTSLHISKILDRQTQSDANNVIIHSDVIEYQLDNMFVNDPVGMSCDVLQYKIHTIKAKVAPIKNIITCLNSINVQVTDLFFSSYIIGHAYRLNDVNLISIDIGAQSIKIAKFINGKMYDQLNLPFGGDAITQEIAGMHNISKTQAERVKILYGASNLHPDDENEGISAVSLANESITIPRAQITKVISDYVNHIANLIKKSMNINDVEHIIISGGVANLHGIAERFTEILVKNVSVANFDYLLDNASADNVADKSTSKVNFKNSFKNSNKQISKVNYKSNINNNDKIQSQNSQYFNISQNKTNINYEKLNANIVSAVRYIQKKLLKNAKIHLSSGKKNNFIYRFFYWIKTIF